MKILTLYTIPEAASKLKVHRTTMSRRVATGVVPTVHISSHKCTGTFISEEFIEKQLGTKPFIVLPASNPGNEINTRGKGLGWFLLGLVIMFIAFYIAMRFSPTSF